MSALDAIFLDNLNFLITTVEKSMHKRNSVITAGSKIIDRFARQLVLISRFLLCFMVFPVGSWCCLHLRCPVVVSQQPWVP